MFVLFDLSVKREIGTTDSRIIWYKSVIYDKKCLISIWTITESTKRQFFCYVFDVLFYLCAVVTKPNIEMDKLCRFWLGQVRLGFLGVFP